MRWRRGAIDGVPVEAAGAAGGAGSGGGERDFAERIVGAGELACAGVVDRAAARLEGRFAGRTLVAAAVRHTIAAAYLDLSLPREAEGQARRAMGLRVGH
jgi:hypothetical protein